MATIRNICMSMLPFHGIDLLVSLNTLSYWVQVAESD